MLEMQEAINRLAGTYGLEMQDALNQIGGRSNGRPVTTTGDTLTDADSYVVFNNASASQFNLPSANTVTAYRRRTLTNKGAGTVTLNGTVSGTASRTLPQWTSYDIYSDGSVWLLA